MTTDTRSSKASNDDVRSLTVNDYCDSCNEFECNRRGCQSPGRCACTFPHLDYTPSLGPMIPAPVVQRRRKANRAARRSRRANR